MVTDRQEEEVRELELAAVKLVKVIAPGISTQAAWIKEADKLGYGCKKGITDHEGMVMADNYSSKHE
jgi:hypothetical protein